MNLIKEVDSNFDGSCPCFSNASGTLSGHCWRTSLDCDCKYSGVHYSDPKLKENAEEIAKWIKKSYLTECEVIYDETI